MAKNTVTEIWRDIPGYEGFYQASSLGRVRSLDRAIKDKKHGERRKAGVVLSPCLSMGYKAVNLRKDGALGKFKVHQLVCMAFHGLPKPGHEVLHGDGSRSNNYPENLRWGTRAENIADAQEHGARSIASRPRRKSLIHFRMAA